MMRYHQMTYNPVKIWEILGQPSAMFRVMSIEHNI